MVRPRRYLDPPVEISKRHTPWFVWLMCGFALTVVAVLIYGFASIVFGGMSKRDVKWREAPELQKGYR
jgi:hypothetical protein